MMKGHLDTFSSKTSELRTNVEVQSCHHVILMSASSCQQQSEQKQFACGSSIEKSNSLGARESG